MSSPKVVLIDQTKNGDVRFEDLRRYADALQHQMVDLARHWKVRADISALRAEEAIPQGAWPIKIVDSLPGQGGVHLDDDRHPYAEAVNGDKLSVAISHELLEMLVDPLGTTFRNAIDCDPYSGGKQVSYLLEVCDPCEITSYEINGVQVSDFVLPAFYDVHAAGPFDLRDTLAAPLPRQVPYGCYISWLDPQDRDPQDRPVGTWHQQRPDGTFVIVPATPDVTPPATLRAKCRWGSNPRCDRDIVLAQANLHNIPAIYQAWA